MVRSCVFVFIAIALCFVSSFCAEATVSKTTAIKVIHDAKQSTFDALEMAKYELKEAKDIKVNIAWYEEKAEKRVFESEAEAKLPGKDNKEAKEIAQILKGRLRYARELYPNAKNDVEKAINILKCILVKAGALTDKAEIEVLPNMDSPNDYTNVTKIASALTNEAEALEKEIEIAIKLLSAAKTTIWVMPAPPSEDLIKKHKADGLAAGAIFETILDDVDSFLQIIGQKKNEVRAAVEAITEILENSSQTLSQRINGFLTIAQGDLSKISQKMIEVQKGKKAIQKWKKYAEKSQESLKTATTKSDAQREFRFIKYYAGSADLELEKITAMLKSAKKLVQRANNHKQSVIQTLLQKDSEQNGEVDELTEKPNTFMKQKETIPNNNGRERETDQQKENTANKEMIIPASTNKELHTKKKSEKHAEEATMKLKSRDTERQTDNEPDKSTEKNTDLHQKDEAVKSTMISRKTTITATSQNSAHQKSDQPDIEKTVQPKDQKSEVLDLDKLHKGPKNITKVPFFGENVPASGDWSDGSMIVSVPLLAALIISAVLH